MKQRDDRNSSNAGMAVKHGPGILTISLDFELYWGVRDKRTLASYSQNLAGVHQAIPQILALFDKHGIHATWATVGLLFCRDAHEAITRYAPDTRPNYESANLSPYAYLQNGQNLDAKYHFAPELIDLIASHAHQEIATHTFSHYYCLEKGQTLEAFKADVEAAKVLARERNLETCSIVFPRNQWNQDYLSALNELGIKCYRGNERSWAYRAVENEEQSLLRRAGRLVDTYLNLCGHQTYPLIDQNPYMPYNFPSSRLLRAYKKRLAPLEGLRLRRIRKSMLHAAKNGEIFHLWWHPHNFGVDIRENMKFLAKVLQEFERLHSSYGMQSANMAELYRLKKSAYE
jgi:peptidoglycan/xylan/chitin deacetylase (PgdA/CDA1 family)